MICEAFKNHQQELQIAKREEMASVLVRALDQFLFLLLLQTIAIIAVAGFNVTIHPHCQEACGGVSIPYPFGIGEGCYKDENFEIKCKSNREGGKMMPIFGNFPVTEFLLQQSQATVLMHPTYVCYNKSGLAKHDSRPFGKGVAEPFFISATSNKFTAIGCNTIVFFEGNKTAGRQYLSGCMTFCDPSNQDDSCTGTGCCQSSSFPEDVASYELKFYDRPVNDTIWEYNPCSYAFVTDNSFKFNNSYLKGDNLKLKFPQGLPLKMDWVIKNETCEEAKKNISSYACSSNSDCRTQKTTNCRRGYTCNCSQGYQGNPYLKDGCQDIDECIQHPCPTGNICKNTPGNHTCSCPLGYFSENPFTIKCYRKSILLLQIKLALGIGIGIISLLVLSFSTYIMRKKRMCAKEKKRFFQQNGGWLLYKELECKGERVRFKIYAKEELEKATNNFDNKLILGRGGQGLVYRGILEGGQNVAIKKSRTIDETQKEEFVKEVLVLSQVNHKNVVKLLGCCLEVEVPMLVYELVVNGTLHDYIHDKSRRHSIPLSIRLRIAAESANALTYLHSAASPPILHRDVKTSNILLDENYVAKLSDFGASILTAVNKSQFVTVVQGTYGYLDPEYMQTFKFSEKSDVYSFGVVLLELLTRKKAVGGGQEEWTNLVSMFTSLMQQGRLIECLDDQLRGEGQIEVFHEIAELAMQCLRINGEERPSMGEVADELQRLKKSTQQQQQQQQQQQHNSEELEILPAAGESSNYSVGDRTVYCSLENTETGC